jgi:hypothetical protein
MFLLKSRFFKFCLALVLVICCSFFPSWLAYSQQPSSGKPPTATTTVKGKLASKVLSNLGIDRRYDLYFDHAVGIVLSPSTSSKFQTWMGEMLAREAGWNKTQSKYVEKLTADFSETELTELSKLSQQPVMKKLLRAEIQVYAATSTQRRQMLNRVWNDYNEGKIAVPANISQ